MRPFAVLLAGLFVSGASAAPRLHVSTSALTPESTVELVLDRAAAGEGAIGKEVKNDWLDIQPAWNGVLFWKEANVIEFRPSQPPALGTNYVFKLKSGHKHLDGSEIPAGEVSRIAAEPFQVSYAALLERYDDAWSPRTATFFLRFNGDVAPDKAAPFLFFESDGGQRVAARTERATFGRIKQPGYLGASWSERFARRGQPDAPPADLKPGFALPNGLLVSPLQPLPEGQNWRLSLLSGLPDASGKTKFTTDSSRQLGNIEPLKVTQLEARVIADSPRRIVADFNLKLPVDLPASRVRIEPTPPNFRVEVQGDELHLLGDFTSGSEWSVTLDPAIASQDGRALGQAVSKKLIFKPLRPEIGLPSQDESQLASGTRKYRLQTVNLAKVHVRVKKLDTLQLIRAQQGYRHYTGTGPDGKELTPTHLLPYELIGGETVADLEIELPNALDTTQPLILDWDQILAGEAKPYQLGFPKEETGSTAKAGPAAALFLEIAGTPKEGAAKATAAKDEEESGDAAEATEDENEGEDEDEAGKAPVGQALIQLTDLGLAWKIVEGESRIFAFSCLTGKPLGGVKLATFAEDAKPLQEATTGEDGLATLPREPIARHLQASLGADRFAIAYDTTLPTVGLWRFPVRSSWDEESAPGSRRAFLFTDRSLYRPGETVHLKGLVRRQDGNDIGAQEAAPCRVVITDPTEREILSRAVEIGADGGFDLTFELPAETTGYHRIVFEYPEEVAKLEGLEDWSQREKIMANARFELPLRVEEFRRNAFELTHTLDQPAPGAKEVSLQLKATYYQGQPVAKGEVQQFTHIAETNFYPDRFRDYLFGDHRTQDFGYWYHYFGYRWDEDNGSRRSDSDSATATLAADGTAKIVAKLPDTEFPATREVSISTEVTDANRQTLTERTETVVHPASVYVGAARLDQLVRAGDHIPIGIVAVTPQGERFTRELPVEVTISREVNEQVRLADENGGTAVRNETRREQISTTSLTLAGDKGTDLMFSPQQAGLHQIELRGKDPEGRPFATVISVHVYGGDEYPWAYEDGIRIKLVAEKKLYQPGDTARVLVLSPIEGTALVTVERERVLRSFLVELKADKPVIEIPLSADDAPNCYVSVLIVKGAQDSARLFKSPQLRLGYCELTVENHRDRLAIDLEVPADSVPPAQELTLTGTVKLPDGSPAANATVTFYAEDEGTLAVMGYQTPDPMGFFYDPRLLKVNCGTSLDHFIAESPEEQSFYNKGFFVGGGDDDLAGMPDLPRRDFNPCAVWQPALTTDAGGKFSATFTLPDTLTRYRVIAIASHGAARFGQKEAQLTVNKPVMIEPQAPRFANEGDTLDVRALVQNASGLKGVWKVTFTPNPAASEPVATLAGAEREKTLTLDAGGSATVIFPVKFTNTGEAVLSWKAEPVSLEGAELTPVLARKLSDRVESRFQVEYPVPLLRQARLLKLGQGETDLLAGLDPALLAGRGHVELELSRSLLLEAAGSVDYLLTYPYGCVEQTTSSMMPWLAVEQLREVVPAFAKYPPEKVKATLQKGADRLLSMQLADGGFTYWPGGKEVVPWASSYAGLGLILADKAGAEVPEAAIDSLCNHLEASLRGLAAVKSPTELENASRALWILALAGREPAAYINGLKDRMAELTPRSRCLLALAAHSAEMDDALAILRSKVAFKGRDDSWMAWRGDSAMALLAWSAIAPEAAETTAAIEKLVRERNPYGHWNTTWTNGWSLLALATYGEHEKDAPAAAVTLTTPDGPQTVKLEVGKPALGFDFPLGGLKLAARSDQRAFVRVKLASKPDIAPQQPVAKNGLQITRFYERVKADGSSEPLDKPKLGDLVRIRLRVDLPTDDARYLVVEDRLPALFEAVNNDFASQAAHDNAGATSEKSWLISHRELRSDRAMFFYDRIFSRGRQEITYLARCTMEGKAVAPPAKVESMYDPDNTALSASRDF